MSYAVLHAHCSVGSVGDSVLSIRDYVNKARELGLTHIALTDHGSMAGMVEFHEACMKASITGIIGLEAYIVEDRLNKTSEFLHGAAHVVLLAKNKEGVKNLLRIHNDAQIDGFYGKPKTDMSVLKKYGKHIIGLSACVGGEIPRLIANKDLEGAEKRLMEYKDALEEFYLEIQPGRFELQKTVNRGILYLAYKTKTPFVATNDIHYLKQVDALVHDTHVKSYMNITDKEDFVYPDTCYFLMEEDEFKESFERDDILTDEVVEAAIRNTNVIAAKCNGEIEYNFEMPKYLDLPEGETEASYLTELCYKALQERLLDIADPVKYGERLEYELDTIQKLGFCGYFLIVRDLLEYARSHNVAVGPGRGSVGGSLVAWLLNFTVADPVKYGLVFERFLSANRVSLPDIDVDFSDTDKMKDYTIGKYGKEHCALVGTFGFRKIKDSIRTAARILNLSVEIADEVCKAVPFRVVDDEGEKLDNPTLIDALRCSESFKKKKAAYPVLFEKAMQIESYPKCTGIHAAGIVISPHNLLEYIPIRVDEKSGRYVSLVTKDFIEKLALKYDFLSLATQAVVDKTVRDVGVDVNLNDDDFFNDEEVWDAIGSKNTIGMFQISSNLYRQRMPRLRPRNLQQLAACLALVRPPCISAGTDEVYMKITEGKAEVEKLDPRYDEITAFTNGITIYQEQVMNIGTAFGLSIDDSYKLMKAISKKHIEQVRPMRDAVWKGAAERGVMPEITTKIWKIVEDAAKYSFNQGHAMSYGIIAYLSAWLKVHYPAEFMANLLTNAYVNGNNKDDKIGEFVADCQRMGLQFLPVDINKSTWEFSVEGGKIRIGFCAIKAFGEAAMNEVLAYGPFKSFDDYLAACRVEKSKLNKTRNIVLTFAGALDSLNSDRTDTLNKLINVKSKKTAAAIAGDDRFTICKGCTVSLEDSAIDIEKSLFRAAYLNAPTAILKPIHFADLAIGANFAGSVYVDRKKEITDRRGNPMAFVDLVANDGSFSGVIFGSIYSKIKDIIRKGAIITITARKDKEESCIINGAA